MCVIYGLVHFCAMGLHLFDNLSMFSQPTIVMGVIYRRVHFFLAGQFVRIPLRLPQPLHLRTTTSSHRPQKNIEIHLFTIINSK